VDARALIDKLGLEPLPAEGGYFVETYRSDEAIPASALDPRYGRQACRRGAGSHRAAGGR
jgi:predicted cupin superfamily sugar epimerase